MSTLLVPGLFPSLNGPIPSVMETQTHQNPTRTVLRTSLKITEGPSNLKRKLIDSGVLDRVGWVGKQYTTKRISESGLYVSVSLPQTRPVGTEWRQLRDVGSLKPNSWVDEERWMGVEEVGNSGSNRVQG